jgi:hypothetical protein
MKPEIQKHDLIIGIKNNETGEVSELQLMRTVEDCICIGCTSLDAMQFNGQSICTDGMHLYAFERNACDTGEPIATHKVIYENDLHKNICANCSSWEFQADAVGRCNNINVSGMFINVNSDESVIESNENFGCNQFTQINKL